MEVMGKTAPQLSQKIKLPDGSLEDLKESNFRNISGLCEGFILSVNGFEQNPIKTNNSSDGDTSHLQAQTGTNWSPGVKSSVRNEPTAIFMNSEGYSINDNLQEKSSEKVQARKKRTPRIEVCQKNYKTVVKISVKDSPCSEDENILGSNTEEENVYENGHVCENGIKMATNLTWSTPEENRDNVIYENVADLDGQNGLFRETGQCDYQNIFSTNCLYVNLSCKNRNKLNGNRIQENESEIQRMTSADLKGNSECCDDDATYENVENTCSFYSNEMFQKNQMNIAAESMMRNEIKGGEEVNDSGTSSDVDSSSTAFIHSQKGNVVVTIKSLQSQEAKKDETCHKRAESLTSSGVGVDSEESDDSKSNISCDSLNGTEQYSPSNHEDHGYHTPNLEDKTGSPVDAMVYQVLENRSIKVGSSLREANTNANQSSHEPDVFNYETINSSITRSEDLFQKKKKSAPPSPLPSVRKLEKPRRNDDQNPLPKNLLRDIESRYVMLSSTYPNGEGKSHGKTSVARVVSHMESKKVKDMANTKVSDWKMPVVERGTYEDQTNNNKSLKLNEICAMEVNTDLFYKFHISENFREENEGEDETFAGIKDYLSTEKSSAITSAKGTIRGVKNRVKAGIATFLQLHENKSYKDKDSGKVVVYTTTMGIVRETYHKCLKVKQILRTLMVKFEERDVFMSAEAQEEIRTRMKCDAILVPQVFVEGQHIGDAETIDRLNETGELRVILKPYKSLEACSTCQICGGYRLLPCAVCKGSKKSIHRNHFTAEFVSLKCMNCDQVGLVRCHAC